MSTSSLTYAQGFCRDLASGTRTAGPVRRHATSSPLSDPRGQAPLDPGTLGAHGCRQYADGFSDQGFSITKSTV